MGAMSVTPIASDRPASVITLIVKPNRYRQVIAARTDSGSVTQITSTLRTCIRINRIAIDAISISLTEEDALNIGTCLRNLNQRIVELRGADYQIGHSYFLPLASISNDTDKLVCLDDIWNYQVVPLLKEYFYGQSDLLRQVLPSFFSLDDVQPQSAGDPVALYREDLVAALNKL